MLIKDENFDFEKFKSFYLELDWIQVPRKLGVDHTDYFYIGKWEDEDDLIHIQIRPSMRMKVSESHKHCDRDGNKIPRDSKDKKFEFGTTVEVLVNKGFVEKIKEIAKPKKENNIQRVNW